MAKELSIFYEQGAKELAKNGKSSRRSILFLIIFFVIRSVEPIAPAKQFEQCVKSVLVGGADKYAACVAIFGEAKQDDFVKAVGVETLVLLAKFYDFVAVLLDKPYGLGIY